MSASDPQTHQLGQSSVPFPSSSTSQGAQMQESESSSSNQTSSDKLSALPTQSSPALGRLRSPSRIVRRSMDMSSSLSSIDSPGSAGTQGRHQVPPYTRASESDGSIGVGTTRQRQSLESDHTSLPATLQGIRQAIAARRPHRRSQSATRSPSPLSGEGSVGTKQTPQQPSDLRIHNLRNLSPRPGKETQTPTSRSPSQSRAASPLRRLGWALHRHHTREEPFIPVDPFRLSAFNRGSRCASARKDDEDSNPNDRLFGCLPLPASAKAGEKSAESDSGWFTLASDTQIFLCDSLPRQAYLILLLGLPALYWSRVARVFEDAEVSKPDVRRMIDASISNAFHIPTLYQSASRGRSAPHAHTVLLPFPEDWNPETVSPALVRFKHSWEQFVDSLLREWKTLNLVSALLCTCVLIISAPPRKRAILTMFQVNDADDDPLTRSAALFGLIFALMSLIYGCVFIVQFGTMRTMDRASRWAEEAQRSKTSILWNIWVLLATPAIWLAWSMIAFCVSILSFVWRTGAASDQTPPAPLTRTQAIGVRTAITAVFALGLLCFAMIIRTFRSYHDARGHRRRLEDPLLGERGRAPERERRDAMEEPREREKALSPSSVGLGLGLTGLSDHALSSPRMGLASVALREVDSEKGDFQTAEGGRGRGTLSPKL
ncbi:uncharacterized protein B0H18DRAFT_232692 [Fomitopsis serialis]|uniref:uncharacterized protein n=1 Tax=Fomitopsis serialis TaxID=139415 RepID=UPI002008E6A9|nr:uncharacterized protein B0H18DRAFT_232692 [Neoantrodia serialis]KAH9928875.1 hypothetical protein B0H18DRAFT_232692 [Neoantrodia serialis]